MSDVIDSEFLERVVEVYHRNLDQETGEMAIGRIAFELWVSRTKARKLLVTAGLICPDITKQALKLQEQGLGIRAIARELGLSQCTVNSYLPYSGVIYNSEHKSKEAVRAQNYRQRNKLAKERVVASEPSSQATETAAQASAPVLGPQALTSLYSEPQASSTPDTSSTNSFSAAPPSQGYFYLHMELLPHDRVEAFKDSIPFSEPESPMEDTRDPEDDVAYTLQRYGRVFYGKYITRDILVPEDMPLFALHYAINKAFGWQNSHLHHFELSQEAFEQLTDNKLSNYTELVGRLLVSPLMEDADRFWNDDYEKGSIKTWLSKKYCGPYHSYNDSELYSVCRQEIKLFKRDYKYFCLLYGSGFHNRETFFWGRAFKSKADAERFRSHYKLHKGERLEIVDFNYAPVHALYSALETSPNMLLERLTLKEVLALQNEAGESEPFYQAFQEYMDQFKALNPRPSLEPKSPKVTDALYYRYDYGDEWCVKLTAYSSADYLLKAQRLLPEELAEAQQKLLAKHAPVCLALDGLPVFDDAGGMEGYCDFLRCVFDKEETEPYSENYDDREEALTWARSLGWSTRKVKPKNLL